MGAQDYVVGNAPSGASYAAPLVGQQLGQTIAGYPDAYMKGRENQRTIALQNAFPDGIPKNPDGSPDINNITNTLGKIGGGQYVQQLMPFLLNQAQGQKFSQGAKDLSTYVEGGASGMPTPTANNGPGATANATGPANLKPQPQSAPQPQAAPQAPQGQPQGDNSGQDTLRSIATEVSGGKDITPVIGTAARVLRINPDAPLTPQQTASVKTFIGNAVRGGPQAAQPAQGQQAPAGPQPAQAGPTAPDDVPDVPGMDMETAKRLALGEAYLRQQAMTSAASNPAQAQAAEKMADSYAARRTQILDYLSKQSQAEYEHALKNKDVTTEAKNARDPAVEQHELKLAQQKNDVDRFGKQYDSIAKIGDQADETIPQLDLAKRLVNDPNFVSGSLAPGSDMMKRLSVAVGMDPNTATPDQLFDKIRAGSILNQIKGMAGTGPVRVAEMKFIDQMIAGRENTPSTLRTLLEIESRLYQRAQAVRDMAHGYNNGHLDTGFDKQVSDFKNKNQLFSKDELKDPRLIAPPAPSAPPPPFPANATPEQKIQQARAYGAKMGLKPGDPFKTPNGIKYVP